MRPITLLSILNSPKSDKNGFHSSGGSYSLPGCSPLSAACLKIRKKMHLSDWGADCGAFFSAALSLRHSNSALAATYESVWVTGGKTHLCELHLEWLIMRTMRHSGKCGEGDLSNTGWVLKVHFEKWWTGSLQTWPCSPPGATTTMT